MCDSAHMHMDRLSYLFFFIQRCSFPSAVLHSNLDPDGRTTDNACAHNFLVRSLSGKQLQYTRNVWFSAHESNRAARFMFLLANPLILFACSCSIFSCVRSYNSVVFITSASLWICLFLPNSAIDELARAFYFILFIFLAPLRCIYLQLTIQIRVNIFIFSLSYSPSSFPFVSFVLQCRLKSVRSCN